MPDDPAGVRTGRSAWRDRLYHVIFEAETSAGRAFDVALLAGIVLSVVAVLLESVEAIRRERGSTLRVIEWTFTILFTTEYVLRVVAVHRPWRYVTSFFGIVDLCSVLPTYLSLLVTGTQSLIVLRAFRLLRIFRVLKLVRFLGEAEQLRVALHSSLRKILVFLGAVLVVVLVVGALMYLIEGEARGFTSIPRAMYWAIVTMTTVGYGDITPQTPLGQVLSSGLMILGYGVIAVPTGIVSVELAHVARLEQAANTVTCPTCMLEGHLPDARFCRGCGVPMTSERKTEP